MPHFEKIYKVEKLSEVSEDMNIESFEYSKRLWNISILREYGEYDICVDIDCENGKKFYFLQPKQLTTI